MAVMAEHWDDTRHRGLSAELKKSLRPYKDNKQVLKAFLYANVPQAGGGMERQPVAGARRPFLCCQLIYDYCRTLHCVLSRETKFGQDHPAVFDFLNVLL